MAREKRNPAAGQGGGAEIDDLAKVATESSLKTGLKETGKSRRPPRGVSKPAAGHPPIPDEPPGERHGLVGRFFVTWTEGRQVQCQGKIVAELPDGFYLIQFFDFVVGQPSTMAIFHISNLASAPAALRQPGSVELFEDAEHMRDWLRHTYRPGSDVWGNQSSVMCDP